MTRTSALWTFAITSIALFMVTLDNLVVTMALPVIQEDLGASIEGLEWTVNAYTLTFAVLLLTGAALGDRFGRRRMFVAGMAVFVLASAAAALAPTIEALVAARAVQGVGGAIVTPLTLTRFSRRQCRASAAGWRSGPGEGSAASWLRPALSSAGRSSKESRGSGSSGSTCRSAWPCCPFALRRLEESHGPGQELDLPGLGLISAGLFGIVEGTRSRRHLRMDEPRGLGRHRDGAASLSGPSWPGLQRPGADLPMRFFRNRTFAATNVASLVMFFGMFGSIFLLAQFLQVVQGLASSRRGRCPGRRCRSSSAIAGALSDRIGGRPLMVTGLALQAAAGSPGSRRSPSPTLRISISCPRS